MKRYLILISFMMLSIILVEYLILSGSAILEIIIKVFCGVGFIKTYEHIIK